ncbi:MAG: PEP-CTERM sorting domain-containing protein [Akkermansiaceae bacterium]
MKPTPNNMTNKIKIHTSGLFAAGLLGLASSADAATIITVNNAGFESQVVADGEAFTSSHTTVDAGASASGGDSTITNWIESNTADHLSFVLNPGSGSIQATEGNNIAFIQNSTISQTLSGFTLGTGDTVSVTFDLWSTNAGNGSTFLVNFAGIGAQNPSTITVGGSVVPQSIDFTVGAGQDGLTTGDLSFQSTIGGNRYRIDNIQVSLTAVPEPSSAVLLGLGSLALIIRRKR